MSDNSYLWHRVAGDIQISDGAVLTADPFSFTAHGDPWRTQSWLADLAYAQLHEIAGLAVARWIPVVVGSVLFAATTILVLRWMPLGLGFTIWSVANGIIVLAFLNPRPVIFSYAMLAVAVLVLWNRKLLWTYPLLIWLWATLHGSFFLGFVLLGTEALRRWDKRLVGVAAASLVATNATAHGWGLWSILVAFTSESPALEFIQEWQTPAFVGLVFIWYPLGLAAIARLVGLRRIRGGEALSILAWALFGMTANRSVPLAWIVLTPWIAESMGTLVPSRRRAHAKGIVVATLVAAMVILPAFSPFDAEVDDVRFPIEAVRYLTGERVYHDDAVGSWIIHTQWPSRLVYIDDRAELYGDQYVRFVATDQGEPVWQEEFEKWNIDQALVRTAVPLSTSLELAGWQTVYEDDEFVVFDRPH